VREFEKKYSGAMDEGPYTFPAYDSATILIAAVAAAIRANGGRVPTREQVRLAVSQTHEHKGVTGVFSFDPIGDAIPPTMAFYGTKGSPPKWTFLSQKAVAGDNGP
jgi:branched-chain amino acid transport system substrate-binding protein